MWTSLKDHRSQYIRNTECGMVNAYRAEMNRHEEDPACLAITIDMNIRQINISAEAKDTEYLRWLYIHLSC